ncbi:hypothetical protein LOTGIDRAFT_174310 [Lottia gigantea]|uniref:DOMON domain-containing protein n=1 Tax=Lottia gigantea TaxID=225164 RepID=V4C8Q8_LOTGI|nr:hypothetical protein LOTGIDRAFT_174310 [Lottia gigantea]ESO98134.1 hypothetical protein LOTGIDRAFT_174310 [Lottia gigantea]
MKFTFTMVIYYLVIRRCPSVHGVWLHLPGSGNSITSVRPSNGIVTSCNGTNNTFILTRNKRGHRDKFVLTTLFRSTVVDGIDFLIFAYDLKLHGTTNTFAYKIDLPEETSYHSRRKRDTVSLSAEIQFHLKVNFAFTDECVKRADDFIARCYGTPLKPRDCGKELTCIRFGSPECAHMECQYFVSYKTLGPSDVEIEISAETMGWVAIGFSSDDSMGGNDDVLVCKRKTDFNEDVEAVAMTNIVRHARPEPKDSNFNLTAARYRDGFIYCKITRPLKINKDDHLDLFNEWYQLYARGHITSTGVMLQHDEIPPTSDNKISVIVPVNIQNSMATSLITSYMVVILPVIATFFVS